MSEGQQQILQTMEYNEMDNYKLVHLIDTAGEFVDRRKRDTQIEKLERKQKKWLKRERRKRNIKKD